QHFNSMNGRPCSPGRSCRKITGEPSVSRTAAATANRIGSRRIKPTSATETSSVRLTISRPTGARTEVPIGVDLPFRGAPPPRSRRGHHLVRPAVADSERGWHPAPLPQQPLIFLEERAPDGLGFEVGQHACTSRAAVTPAQVGVFQIALQGIP